MKHEYFKVYNVTGIRQNHFLCHSMNPDNIDKKLIVYTNTAANAESVQCKIDTHLNESGIEGDSALIGL